MKAMNTILKIVTALAAVVGFIYVIATYGKQIVAWAESMLAKIPGCPKCEEAEAEVVEEPAEEAPAAEEPVAEEAVEEEAAPEVVVAEHEPVAEEQDFAE